MFAEAVAFSSDITPWPVRFLFRVSALVAVLLDTVLMRCASPCRLLYR
jgi:hypothetical protein